MTVSKKNEKRHEMFLKFHNVNRAVYKNCIQKMCIFYEWTQIKSKFVILFNKLREPTLDCFC